MRVVSLMERESKRVKALRGIALVAACAMALLVLPAGCREAEQMQSFSDHVISLVRERVENGGAASSASRNLLRYIESGFSDLDSARKAAADLGQVHELDLELLRKIEAIKEPDTRASDILLSLRKGFQEVDNGNYAVKKELENAERQGLHERATLFDRIIPALEESASGLRTVISALDSLQQYIRENQLEGMAELLPLVERLARERALAEESLDAVRRSTGTG
jgi:hypothetical protein